MAKPWDDYDDSNKMSSEKPKNMQIARGGGSTAVKVIGKIRKEREERQDYQQRQEQSPATTGKLS